MDNYGIYKHLCTDNSYVSLAKTLSSAASTEATQKTIKRITKDNIVYAHMGQLIIKDGICYASFIENPGNDSELHDSSTSRVVLAVFELARATSSDFNVDSDITFYKVGGKGDFCAGHKAVSIFKDNSMCLVGDTLYVCFSFIAEDGNSHIFSKSFNIKTSNWGKEAIVSLLYKGKVYDFSDKSLNEIYVDKGAAPNALGLIELVSAWNEYEGEYYATGITIEQANNGFIVKTTDFSVMEIVDVIPFNENGMAEIASYIYKDRLFVACRQDYGIPYLILGVLNLKTMIWEHNFKIPDGNSRPWFFKYRDELYLINTVEERKRRYATISHVRILKEPQPFFNYQHPIESVLTLKSCGSYFATAEYNGDIYYVASHKTESFGKLCIKIYDEDEVNKKLLSMFS